MVAVHATGESEPGDDGDGRVDPGDGCVDDQNLEPARIRRLGPRQESLC